MLFGGSRRFTSSAASSTRSRPSHAIGVVSPVHTRVVAAGPDPEPHSGRCSMPNSSAKTLAFVTSFPGDESSFSRTMGVPMELRDDAAGEGLDGLPLGRRVPGAGAEPGKLRGSDRFPRSRRARMSGARRSERLRTANRRTSSSTMPFAAAISSHRWAAPSATVPRSPSIPPRRRPETESSYMSRGDRFRGSLRVRDDLTQGSRTSSPWRSTRSVVRGRSRCAARAGGRNRSRTS